MKVYWVYRFLPALVITISDDRPMSWGDARTNGFVVRVRKFRSADEGVIRHELVHVKQWYRMLLIFHPLLYRLWPRYRIWSEAEAFREQLRWDPPEIRDSRLSQYTNLLASCYGGELTLREARELLTA